MEISVTQDDGVTILSMAGRLDVLTSKDLNDSLSTELDNGARNLVLNFAAVDYVSSSGLRVLLQARKRLKAGGGTIVLCGVSEFVKSVLVATGFDTIFTIAADVPNAIKECKAGTKG